MKRKKIKKYFVHKEFFWFLVFTKYKNNSHNKRYFLAPEFQHIPGF